MRGSTAGSPMASPLAEKELSLLDRWVLSKVQKLVADVTAEMDDYDVYDAANMLDAFVERAEQLVRAPQPPALLARRRRGRRGQGRRLQHALCRADHAVQAARALYALCGRNHVPEPGQGRSTPSAPDSVHHQDWPVADESLLDEDLLADMDMAINVASLGRSARNSSNVKLRQPLAKAMVVADARQQVRLERLADIVLDELNVKSSTFCARPATWCTMRSACCPSSWAESTGGSFPSCAGPWPRWMPSPWPAPCRPASRSPSTSKARRSRCCPRKPQVRMRAREGLAVADAAGIVVGIDTELTPELVQARAGARPRAPRPGRAQERRVRDRGPDRAHLPGRRDAERGV